jgi:hypothetical protein
MKCKTIAIDGVEYRPVDDTPKPGEALRLVLADNRGLLFVGRCSLDEGGDWLTIYGARCVIYWGTTGHIAQLAKTGPTLTTKLGTEATVRVRMTGVVAVYDCASEWK